MKSILFYLTRFPGYGGIETVTEIIGCKLFESGYQVSIMSHLSQSRQSLLMKQCRFFAMPNTKKWDSRDNIIYARKILSENHFDAIVYQDSYAPTHRIVCQLSREYSIPLFVFEHSAPLFLSKSRGGTPIGKSLRSLLRHYILFPLEEGKMKRRKKMLLKYCEKYVLLSESFKQEIDKIMGTTKYDGREKMISIHNPIKVTDEITNNKEKIVLFVGRLEPVKRVDMMLYVWSILEKKYPEWRFVIVGDGSQKDVLIKNTKQLGLERVSFEGYTLPTNYYKKASLFWMTSSYEGFSMTLVEAMSYCCVPIAMDSYSSIHDIIDNNENGILVNNNDIEGFVNANRILMDDDRILKSMSLNAWNKSKTFDLENVINNWFKLFGEKEQLKYE